MAICNLFKKLTKQTGEFLMFSQWAEDLTQNHSKGYKYRAVPSRFIAANIDFSKLLQSDYSESNDLNISLPTYLQKYFENGCAVGKSKPNWTPELSSNLFWNTMEIAGLLNIDPASNVVKEFKYIGDINIQSYDEKNGMGYNEMYCYIPNDSKEMIIKCSKHNNSLYVDNKNDILEGYKEDDKFELNGKGVSGLRYEYGCKYVFANDIDKVSDTKKYDINCLIILYDIKSWDESGESNDLYTDIPLGLYLPGCFDQNIMTNPIIKWVSNSIIYNSGTSYGIRICTRFSLVPNSDNLLTTDIELVNSDEYASMCKIMAGISDNLELMKSITTQSVFTSDNLKDTLNMFQNSKTNVPYILEVNGIKYWFVNGKNTGVAIDGSDGFNKYEGCDDKEVYDLLEELSLNSIVTETKLYPYDINTGNIKYYQKKYFDEIQDSVDVLMRWEFKNKYTQEIIIPQQVSYTYEGETFNVNSQNFTIYNVNKDGRYRLNITYNNKNYPPFDLNFKFYYQSYFGFVNSEDMDNFFNSMDITHILKSSNVKKYTLPSAYNRFKFKSNGDYIVYAFPKEYGEINNIWFVNNHDNLLYDFERYDTTIDIPCRDGSTKPVEYCLYYTHNYTGVNTESVLDFTNINNRIDTCQVI